MICLLLEVQRSRWVDQHQHLALRWRYGDQEGLYCAALCACPHGLHSGHVRPTTARRELRAAIRAAVERQHGLRP